ncbi:MAG: metallophosphoesterase family protein [Actinomycetota bacterium]|nr:metallophosphoesterase family protein [Actinomycetota bacterium]
MVDARGPSHEVVGRGKGRRLRWWLQLLLVAGAGTVAALVMTGLGARTEGEVGPGKVVLQARPGPRGSTRLQLPPVGRVTADTHGAPVLLEARIDEVDIERVQTLLKDPDPQTRLAEEVRRDLRPLFGRLAVRSLLLAAVAGAVGGALLPGRRWWHALVGALAGAFAVGLLGGLTWRQFDIEAFNRPSYRGPVERAPSILSAARRHVQEFGQVRDRVRVLSAQVADLYAASAGSEAGGEAGDEVRILHVSDVHSNPLGAEVARRLAESFRVQAVLDTGDLTSFGYAVEARVGDVVRSIPAPYLFVPGNHDSPENRAALALVPNLTVLDDDVISVGGLRVMGAADPTFTATNEVDSEEAAATRVREAPRVAAEVAQQRPDVLAVHDRRLAEASTGKVPLVVAGHLHRRTSESKDGTLILTVGSTGSTGLGAFTVDSEQAYEAEVLHFSDGRLKVVDYVTVRGISGEFLVERQIIRAE